MAVEIRAFTVTIPAGTSQSAPQVTSLAMPDRVVEKIEWMVPPGPNGTMGWYLAMGGVQVVPYGQGSWVVTDNEHGEWVLDGLPDTGAWQLYGYNTGNYDHAVHLRLLVSLVAPAGPAVPLTVIPATLLTG